MLEQVFYPQKDVLNLIYVAVNGHGETGKMVVTVRDEAGDEVARREITCSEMVPAGAQGIWFNERVTPRAKYSYTVTFEGVEDGVPVIQTAPCLTKRELGELTIDGEVQEERIYGLFVYQTHYTDSVSWRGCMGILCVMLLFLILYRSVPVWHTRLFPVFAIGHAALGVLMIEFVIGTPLRDLGWSNLLCNLVLCSTGFFVLYLLAWKERAAVLVGSVLCLVIGIAEYYVIEFRGLPIVLSDILSIRTAEDVAGTYAFDVTERMVVSVLLLAALFLLETRVRFVKYPLRVRGVVLAAMAVFSVCGFGCIDSLPLLQNDKDGHFFWNMPKSYMEHGYLLSTYIYEKFQVVKKPEGYSGEAVRLLAQELTEAQEAKAQEQAQKANAQKAEEQTQRTETQKANAQKAEEQAQRTEAQKANAQKAEEQAQRTEAQEANPQKAEEQAQRTETQKANTQKAEEQAQRTETQKSEAGQIAGASGQGAAPAQTDGTQLPNIIAIMNESYTDFASVGGLETSIPVTPFIDSLTENTIKGNLYVSVYGSGTANSEFEFLTGSTMKFLPNGSIPYQAYIDSELPSLASYLKEYGYYTLAAHFAQRTNWKRDKVYPLLGFDTYLSDEFSGNMVETVHNRISDRANYEQILKCYEEWKEKKEKKETENFFCFNITFQNHGGYKTGYRCDDPPHYTGGPAEGDVDEYLSLLHVSDQAFEELVRYFEKEEEPTVILMFGDHWPRLDDAFVDSVTTRNPDAGILETAQQKYQTMFLLWANYDIEEAQIDRLSANYLSTLLLKTAGVPLNGYYSFLDELAGDVPVVNSLGYMTPDGACYGAAEELGADLAGRLSDYELLEYENLFGKTEGLDSFYN